MNNLFYKIYWLLGSFLLAIFSVVGLPSNALAAAGDPCQYSELCNGSGTHLCNGTYDASGLCNYNPAVSPNCSACSGGTTSPSGTCPYSQLCSGGAGTQTCTGKPDSNGTCHYDPSVSPNCSTCNIPGPTPTPHPGGSGGCCSGGPSQGTCRQNEVCDIQNGSCSTGFSCRSLSGCAVNTDCGYPQRNDRCVGGQCVPFGPSTCQSASSLQARFQLSSNDSWGTIKQIQLGKSVSVALFRNGKGEYSGSPVNGVAIADTIVGTITGPDGSSRTINVATSTPFTPPQAGTYTLKGICSNIISDTATLTVTSTNLVGNVDQASCSEGVNGWVCDPTHPSASLRVDFYADGQAGTGTGLSSATADQPAVSPGDAQGIASACGGTSNHRFTYHPPASLSDGSAHPIYPYAIGTTAGDTLLLNNQTFQCGGGQGTPTPTPGVGTPTVTPGAGTPTATPGIGTPTLGPLMTVSGTVFDARTNSGIRGALVVIFNSTLNLSKNVATGADGKFSVNNFIHAGDTYSIKIPNAPTGFVNPPTLNNTGAICNLNESSYENQNSNTALINTACTYNSSPNCGTSCDFAYNAPYTTKYRIAEGSAANLDIVGQYSESDYSSNPLVTNYVLKDTTPGPKTLFVRFYFSDDSTPLQAQKTINYSPNPTIDSVACTFSLTGTGTQFTIKGTNLGSTQGRGAVLINNKPADVKSWGISQVTSTPFPTSQVTPSQTVTPPPATNTPAQTSNAGAVLAATAGPQSVIVVTIPDRISSEVPVQATIDDGRTTNSASCTISQTTVSLRALVDCLPGNFSQSDVTIQVYQNAKGVTKPFYPTSPQTFALDAKGMSQGFAPTLESGKEYVLIIKGPNTTARAIKFTASDGTTSLPDVHLPAGNIFPLAQPDSAINSFDVAEMYREWALNGTTGKAGDLNQDGAVNSLDYACLRNNLGKNDESFSPPAQ